MDHGLGVDIAREHVRQGVVCRNACLSHIPLLSVTTWLLANLSLTCSASDGSIGKLFLLIDAYLLAVVSTHEGPGVFHRE